VRVSLVVIDNGGAGTGLSSIRGLWPGACVVQNAVNRGLGPAANEGARLAPGDVVLFLNPDTRAEGDPFSAIARAFDHREDVVAAAPLLTEMDASAPVPGPLRLRPPGSEDQATFQLRRLPTLSGDARELLLIDHIRPNNRARRKARYADASRAAAFPVEQAAAAALAVRKDVFLRIGGFDERYVPAWHEDVDLCERLSREGVILFEPAARFRHRGGASASRLGYARFLPIFYRNALIYRRQRYGLFARLAYRTLLAAGMLLRLAALPFRPEVPRPRKEAALAYVKVLAVSAGLLRPNPKLQLANHKSHG
jgi:GT2 family glycosyltransferase